MGGNLFWVGVLIFLLVRAACKVSDLYAAGFTSFSEYCAKVSQKNLYILERNFKTFYWAKKRQTEKKCATNIGKLVDVDVRFFITYSFF